MLALSGAASAADKGGPAVQPPVKISADGTIAPAFSGCYVAGHGALATYQVDNLDSVFKRLGVGAGCDFQSGRMLGGGGVTYDFGKARELSLNAKLGATLNPYLAIYGLAQYSVDGETPKPRSGTLALGGGVEAYASRNLSLFLEATKDVRSFGVADSLDEAWQARAGLKYRFGSGL